MAKLCSVIAQKLAAAINCEKRTDMVDGEMWRDRHLAAIEDIVSDYAPSGSGFDSGTQFDFDKSTPHKLVFRTAFHHTRDGGYTCWTEHNVVVVADLVCGFDFKVTGRDYNGIKNHIGDTFHSFLEEEVDAAEYTGERPWRAVDMARVDAARE